MTPQTRAALVLSATLLGCLLCAVLSGVAYTLFQEIVYPASLAAPVSASVETSNRPYSSTHEAEYYRGVYEMCYFLYTVSGGSVKGAMSDCRKLKERAIERDWFRDGPSWAGVQ